MDFHKHFTDQVNKQSLPLNQWWESQKKKFSKANTPFYLSLDIRESLLKTVPVDANLFPAGFNNVSVKDREVISAFMGEYLRTYYSSIKKIALLTEEHSYNRHYWDNVYTLKTLIEKQNYEVIVCVAKPLLTEGRKIKTASGKEISWCLLSEAKGGLIISNNDFSVDYDLPKDLPCIPPLELGWRRRKKSDFFFYYNELVKEFSEILKISPWHLQLETELFSPFDVSSPDNLKKLEKQTEAFIQKLKQNQKEWDSEDPYIFLKNNCGTYGLGVTTLFQSNEISKWSYKERKRLKATKGGGGVKELILQEGVASDLKDEEGRSAEIVAYMLGFEVAGSFLRIHGKKNSKQSLNRPGVEYKALPLSQWEKKSLYTWICRLSVLAVQKEMEKFK